MVTGIGDVCGWKIEQSCTYADIQWVNGWATMQLESLGAVKKQHRIFASSELWIGFKSPRPEGEGI